MKQIPVAGGLVALVDDEDYERCRRFSWSQHRCRGSRTLYARAFVKGSKPHRYVYLHRIILDAAPGRQVDHVDGNGLNCQRYNLRLATANQNHQNTGKQRTIGGKPTSSSYKGVTWNRARKVWVAQTKLNRKGVTLGYFEHEVEAATAYNAFARKQFGEFARLNVLGEGG